MNIFKKVLWSVPSFSVLAWFKILAFSFTSEGIVEENMSSMFTMKERATKALVI